MDFHLVQFFCGNNLCLLKLSKLLCSPCTILYAPNCFISLSHVLLKCGNNNYILNYMRIKIYFYISWIYITVSTCFCYFFSGIFVPNILHFDRQDHFYRLHLLYANSNYNLLVVHLLTSVCVVLSFLLYYVMLGFF